MKRHPQQVMRQQPNPAMPGGVVGPATVTPVQLANTRPEFIRLPKSGTLCPWTGLSRSKLNELVLPTDLNGHRPPVRSVSLRNRGQVKAVRLINFDSLLGYLRSLEGDVEPTISKEPTDTRRLQNT